MSTPAELSARLREETREWYEGRHYGPEPRCTPEESGLLDAFQQDTRWQAADAIDALQAQVEVLRGVITEALLMHATGELQIANNDPAWPERARAALTQSSDAEMGEMT